jgi:hypothetical protein
MCIETNAMDEGPPFTDDDLSSIGYASDTMDVDDESKNDATEGEDDKTELLDNTGDVSFDKNLTVEQRRHELLDAKLQILKEESNAIMDKKENKENNSTVKRKAKSCSNTNKRSKNKLLLF